MNDPDRNSIRYRHALSSQIANLALANAAFFLQWRSCTGLSGRLAAEINPAFWCGQFFDQHDHRRIYVRDRLGQRFGRPTESIFGPASVTFLLWSSLVLAWPVWPPANMAWKFRLSRRHGTLAASGRWYLPIYLACCCRPHSWA